ncbi:MAG: lysophospholipid acyltransferase family protein [Planctomycetaceae bacterium]
MTDAQNALPHPTRPNWTWLLGRFLLQIAFTVWFRFRVRGLHYLPESGGGLVLSNHQSHLDPLLLQIALHRPIGFLARDNLFRVPFVGWVLRRHYVLGINRESVAASVIRESVRRMQHGFLLGIFPEGTRTQDGSVGEFKPGFVAIVRRAKLPIYPVGVAGAFEALPRGTWFPRPRRVRIVYGEPLTYAELEPLCQRGRERELVELVRDRVTECRREAEAWRLG